MELTEEQLTELYNKEFSSDMTFAEMAKKMDTYKHKQIDDLRKKLCNDLLSAVSEGTLEYPKDLKYTEDNLFGMLLNQIKKLSEKYNYYHALYQFFKGNYKKTLDLVKKDLKNNYDEAQKTNQMEEFFFDELAMADIYFVPYKNAFSGFWDEMAKIIQHYPCEKNMDKLCILMGKFYDCESNEQKAELLQEFIGKYPEFSIPKEFLGVIYQEMKMWQNAIACFESVEDNPVYFFEVDLLWMLAWAYGKCRDYKNEELYYRKVIEIDPTMSFAQNNLGYCLMKQKRYQEAKEILEKCISEKTDLPFSANNYLRVLISLGRNKDAKAFVKNSGFKLDKKLVEKTKQLDSTNARLKKNAEVAIDSEEDDTAISSKETLKIKGEQFSNEKLLEDELAARIESGRPVFGEQLKIYKRKGEYGRQYIIPVGRLDLLCEDTKGDLYVIELKKDSGYDDAYQQTADYLEWFEKNRVTGNQKVYGIICLNQPTQELLDKVHADDRMRIFEYQISYSER